MYAQMLLRELVFSGKVFSHLQSLRTVAKNKKYFLPRIQSGQDVWCQGYSEPDAGSDLAAIATTATLDEETNEWVINGQKLGQLLPINLIGVS